jgi:2-dehydro-3-deoxygalactonokinase
MSASRGWIGVDWGIAALRAWAFDPDGAVRAEAASETGALTLAPDEFEPTLLGLIGCWLGETPVDVVVCGMAGAREGWAQADYAAVPCPPDAGAAVRAPSGDPRLRAWLLAGLRQDRPADVMRGEETALTGLLIHEADFDGVACLPGFHTKWAHVSAGEVVSFESYMTGEIIALLMQSSILARTVGDEGWEEEEFLEAVEDALARPDRVAARLFRLRAAALIDDLDPVWARSRLWGMLIGAELAAAKPYWLGREVVLIGEAELAGAYRDALAIAGLGARLADADTMTRDGLGRRRERLLTGR